MSRGLIEKTQKRLEREVGTIYQSLEGRIRFALAFPGVYRLGMSALGLQIVYGLLNSMPGVTCERVFLPDPIDEKEFNRSKTRLFTLESQTPITDFDVLAFSVSYELDYANLVKILVLSGLPVYARDRNESHPLVVAGGPCATFNPEPLADIVDIFVIGEAEEVVGEIVKTIEESSDEDREAFLRKLSQIPGVYVPRFYTPRYNSDGTIEGVDVQSPAPARVTKRVVQNLDHYNNLSLILTPEAEFADMLLAEAIRGCKRQCRFCVAGYINLPIRQRQISNLPDGARVGLVGSAVFDHPEATAICESFTAEGRQFSISSTRIESLTPELAKMMYMAGQRTMTIAPEAGTERLRGIINKSTTDEQIFEAAEIAASANFQKLKLYFMVGLPGETPEDIDAIPNLAGEITRLYPSLKVQISASCYVPKPSTPFQWCGMAPIKALSNAIKQIKKHIAGNRRIEVGTESPREAYIQAWLARGDRRVSEAIVAAATQDMSYAQAASEIGLDTDFYATRLREPDEILPWDHIDLLVKKEYLRKEYTRAFEGKATAPCVVGSCVRCGVCKE